MSDDLIGLRLDNYEIESTLGRGGMARIYRARDVMLKRPVAIKVMEPDLRTQEKYLDRFEREAQAIAALEHSHILPVYYFGKWRDLYYMAMKFVEGQDLATLMHRYTSQGEYMPVGDIMEIVEAVSSALDYAHHKGVIHRDVKPANVLVDSDGHPYLTDFGLALTLGQGTLGEVFGSPHYIAPEQARNSADAVPQSDFYSLGVMLFELFTGIVPFNDPNPTALALQHVMNEPPPPRAINPDLPPEIEAVILKALAKRPEDRYQSGRELVAVLRTALQDAAGRPGDVVEFPALPPLPPGFEPPPPLKPSTLSVGEAVRESLAERPTPKNRPSGTRIAPRERTLEAGQTTSEAQRSNSGCRTWLPLAVLAIVIVAVIAAVAAVALNVQNNNRATPPGTSAQLPSVTSQPIAIQPTPIPPTFTLTATDLPTQTSLPSATSTQPPTLTPVPPTNTLLPTTIPPINGPTVAPEGWLPVRFIYNADAFYWMNDSNSNISVEPYAFERVGGPQRFDANRFAFWTLERGRCMALVFTDVGQTDCPEGRRPNAWFTPTRTQGIDFWTGNGQFRVLWRSQEIAICDIAAGQCTAYLPDS